MVRPRSTDSPSRLYVHLSIIAPDIQ